MRATLSLEEIGQPKREAGSTASPSTSASGEALRLEACSSTHGRVWRTFEYTQDVPGRYAWREYRGDAWMYRVVKPWVMPANGGAMRRQHEVDGAKVVPRKFTHTSMNVGGAWRIIGGMCGADAPRS